MRFASLGSGSRGNAWVVEAGATRVLIDCGFGPREVGRRLGRLGLAPIDIAAVVLTHEHSDHVSGALACERRYGWRVRLTRGTHAGLARGAPVPQAWLIDDRVPFVIGDAELIPFTVPHDAREPVQFVVSDGQHRLGMLTDAGHVTAHMVSALDACDALVLECNHDVGLLRAGRYPRSLKQRIEGRWGHLDNQAAAGLLARLDVSKLRHLIAAHLSEENNRPELARRSLAKVLGCNEAWIGVARQDTGTDWRSL